MKLIRNTSEMIMFLAGQPQDQMWELKEYKKGRSRSQNSYYWELAGEVVKKTARFGANINEIHNRNLRDLGLREYVNGQPICVYLPDTEEAEKAALNAEKYHIKPTSQTKVGKDGDVFRCYVMLRGSHTFTTEEFSNLVDLMIQEAQAVGVQTITPLELAKIRQLEAEAERRKQDGKHNA